MGNIYLLSIHVSSPMIFGAIIIVNHVDFINFFHSELNSLNLSYQSTAGMRTDSSEVVSSSARKTWRFGGCRAN